MKKLCMLFVSVAAILVVSCSNSESPAGFSVEDPVASEDSTRVLVYSYEDFSSYSDVSILDEDTTEISIDSSLAVKGDDSGELPRKANVIVVWGAVHQIPYFLRVNSVVKLEKGRLFLKVDKATAFEALPQGDYNFSTDIFVDMDKMYANDANGSENDGEPFYDEMNNTYHPIVILEDRRSDDANGSADYEDLAENTLDDLFNENGVLDLRELLTSDANFSVDRQIVDFDFNYGPHTFQIPGLGKTIGDYQGTFTDLFNGTAALEKAFNEFAATGEKTSVSGFMGSAFLKMGKFRYASKTGFHIGLNMTWYGKPKKFEVYEYGSSEIELSNIGLGLGVGISGEKQLTNFRGKTVIFKVGFVPVPVEFTWNLYFKYNIDAYALMDYPIEYKYKSVDTVGFYWASGKGFNKINKKHSEKSYNKAKSFEDFVTKSKMAAIGDVNVGVYFRVGMLFGCAGGPTIGVGGRLDLHTEVGVNGSFLYNEDGSWANADPYGQVKLDFVIPLAVGGKVQIPVLHKTLFERSYDVWDMYTFNIFDLKTENFEN